MKGHAYFCKSLVLFESCLHLSSRMGVAPAKDPADLLYPVITGVCIAHQGLACPFREVGLYYLLASTVIYAPFIPSSGGVEMNTGIPVSMERYSITYCFTVLCFSLSSTGIGLPSAASSLAFIALFHCMSYRGSIVLHVLSIMSSIVLADMSSPSIDILFIWRLAGMWKEYFSVTICALNSSE